MNLRAVLPVVVLMLFLGWMSFETEERGSGTPPAETGDSRALPSIPPDEAAPVGHESPDASDLFTPIDVPLGKAPDSVVRQRAVRFHPEALRENERVEIPLFDGEKVATTLRRLSPALAGSPCIVLDGPVEEGQGTVTLAINEGVVFGKIRSKRHGLVTVEYKGDGVHVFSRVDEARLGHCEGDCGKEPVDPGTPRENRAPADGPPVFSAGSGAFVGPGEGALRPVDSFDHDLPVVDLLVVYTPQVRQDSGGPAGIQALIALAVAETNLAYRDSLIFLRLRLAHAEEVVYSQAGAIEFDLYNLTFPDDGMLDGVQALREAVGADLVSLIVNTQSAAIGVAWMYGSYSVCDRSALASTYVFAHEVGHNLGARHDRAVSSGQSGYFPFSYGFRYPGRWRTIMSYGSEPQIRHFSNPEVLYDDDGAPSNPGQGGGLNDSHTDPGGGDSPGSPDGGANQPPQPTGIDRNLPNGADNAYTLNASGPIVARRRAPRVLLADAGPARVVTDLDGDGVAPVTLDASGTAGLRGTGRFEWYLGSTLLGRGPRVEVNLPGGRNEIELRVADEQSADGDVTSVTVVLNQPPVADAGPDLIIEDREGHGFVDVPLDASGTVDADSDPLEFAWLDGGLVIARGGRASVPLGLGRHDIELVVFDTRKPHGVGRDSRVVRVVDPLRVPREFPTLQAAVDAAFDGDVVLVAAGTYTGDGNRDIDFHGRNIHLKSEGGPEQTIIDVQGAQSDLHMGFFLRNGETGAALIEGFTLTGAGTGVLCIDASVTVRNCRFTGNAGQGFYGWRSFASRIENCEFVGNLGVAAVWCDYPCNVTLASCLIANNETFAPVYGAGVVNLVNCTITSNRCWWPVVTGEDPATIANCIIWGNLPPAGSNGPDTSGFSPATVIRFSLIKGGWPGIGAFDADPGFVGADRGDYRLSLSSPCLDAADGDFAPITDLRGKPRVDLKGVKNKGRGAPSYADIGALETSEDGE